MFVLLDIDGVMVPAASWKAPENLDDGFPVFSKKAVEALKSILNSDTEVVLTTSHKMRFTLSEWKAVFERRGVRIEKLSRLDANPHTLQRKDELLNWFSNRVANNDFLIIDDDSSLHGLPSRLKERWIKTSSLVGLTSELVSQLNLSRI